jgi:tetratricopeptide (TPR) repeat protein
MSEPREFPLESIRTDGWFERIGEGIGSFQALCDIIGARFFAFAMITGARITALTVDRRNPSNTLVDFVVGGVEEEVTEADTQRLTLGDFRRRLVSALVAEEPAGPAPERATDTEAVQLFIGVRYLLLAPLYGYSLEELTLDADGDARLSLLHDGIEEVCQLEELRMRLRSHVREELDRVQRGAGRGAIDLGRVVEAEEAAQSDDHVRVLELLGSWPAPLAIFLRTPEGQLLTPDTRGLIAKGLGLLGSACIALGEIEKGEEVLRLGVQYAGDGNAAADIFARLGEAMLADRRAGEAIAPLRRAANLGAAGARVWPRLAEALAARGRHLAALGAIEEARAAGVAEGELGATLDDIHRQLGSALDSWRELVVDSASS